MQDVLTFDNEQGQAADLRENCVLFALTVRTPGNRRKGRIDKVETDADKAMLSLSKELLDSPELRSIKSLDGDTRRTITKKAISLPGVFRSGTYVLPLAKLNEADQIVRDYETQRADLVADFMREYPRRKDEARERLRSQFNEDDYPSPEKVRGAFGVEYSYFTIGTPDNLSRSIFEREREKAADLWRRAGEEAQRVLREAMADLVGHMVERLTPDEDGKPRVFRDTLVANLAEFLRDFPGRNVTNDTELAELATKARRLLDGVPAEDLRKNEGLRDTIQRGMTEVKARLDTMVIDRPGRKFKDAE